MNAIEILSNITVHMKYAKYIPIKSRRETWEELCIRNMEMHIKTYPQLEEQIRNLYVDFVMTKKVLPSMRSMQFAGKSIEISPNRIYNCAYMPLTSLECFGESMFLLLGGTGVGYSVQRHHVEQLPEIRKPNPSKNRRYLIADSIEGWGDAVKILMKAYFGGNISTPVFDYTDIRPKGSPLITSGGKSPGPAPLRECLVRIENMLKEKQEGDQLSTLETHDIMCYIADAVLAGGIRRAALISLFSADDMKMISCKSGSWWENNPQRGRANNSAVLIRNRITKNVFMKLWERIQASGCGEPGLYFSNDKDWGTNPCCEIALRPFQFCNLTEINADSVESADDFIERSKAAAFLGTLQAGYTDFHYLREVWKKTTERDALLGVSMTGIASNKLYQISNNLDTLLENANDTIKLENKRVADIIGIKPASRLTCIKPAGTTSLTLGTSSGIHAWHSDYYIRRIRVGKNEAIYSYLLENHPKLVEDEYFSPHDTAVISVPQKAPAESITRENENAISLLERVRLFSRKWVRNGHVDGINTHNVSATISVKEDEWNNVGEWMWNNREYYNGLSVLPHDGGSYTQAPFETITEEIYEEMVCNLETVDLTKIIELEDNTDLQGEIACAGGLCEV
tara:strand:- start:791 stop:2668 length:1878 start_codon:yes stop_codon:yes gene_type:complete